ncbi:MAG: thioredoxin family protein [Campylobacterota bacterium]|nr:thioredoxin family protein [Campylobacterota bacterium]
MKRLIKVWVLISIVCTFSIAKDLNINSILNEATKSNKKVMFFFHIPHCPYCDRMLNNNFKDKNILDEINKSFILVDIYTADKGKVSFNDFKGTRKNFASYLEANVVPATLFMNNDGQIIHKAMGYRNKDEYITEIKYVSTDSYTRVDLEKFIEELEFADYDE